MPTIWKFPLEEAGMQTIEMPAEARLLTVQMQGNQGLMLWAQVDPAADREHRQIAIYGTGHEVPVNEDGAYLGTFQVGNGMLVFHVFDLGPVRQ